MLGEVIHGYRVDRALAGDKGGFGDVFFATHIDSGAEAVVKVLKPEMSVQRDIVTRFFNEARAAASVHHPGVVRIHNVGYHGERAYLLMERLYGDDLENRLQAGPLPIERAIVFMRQAAGAVGAAHDRGIVHRDLKPANLFVVPDPDVVGGERVKVLDFGIAKLTVDAGAGKTQGVFGTPAYMSPEQCASAAAVDGRADLYSLGCIFYELVCGRPPFGHGGLELVAAHLRDAPPPPRAIAPWVPPAVEQVILRLLEKQPERRVPSCAALIALLDEAAAVSGLAGASAPRLPAAGSYGGSVPHATTLGAAAGALAVPPARRGRGAWLGLGAVVVVAGAAAAILVVSGRHQAGPGMGSAGSGSAEILTAAGDAGAPSPDAVQLAMTGGDAAPLTPPDARRAEPDAGDEGSAGEPEPPDTPETVDTPAPRSPGSPQDPAAAKLNEQGKAAMYGARYEQARQLFSQAIARDPRAKYFVNLATADLQLGYFDASADALRRALGASPDDAQLAKIQKLFGLVASEAGTQGLALHPPISAAELGAQAAPAVDAPRAPSQAEIASRLNDQGKDLMYADRYSDAARKFQEAVARVPEAKYFVNLCTARIQEGKLDEAVTACEAVALNHPTAAEQDRARRLIQVIESEARKQNIQLH